MILDQVKKFLTPPGNGVYTVNTGKELKTKLQAALYPQAQDVDLAWAESWARFNQTDCALLGIPSDCGGGILRGANWGPLALREYLLSESNPDYPWDMGDIKVIPHLLDDKYLNPQTVDQCQLALYGVRGPDLPVSPLSIANHVLKIIYKRHPQLKIFAIGGDHSVSYPLIAQWIHKTKLQQKKFAVIHFDAHTDLLPQRLGIDLCFGTWAFQILNQLNNPQDLIQIGIRSSAKDKNYWQQSLGVQQFWANEIINDYSQVQKQIVDYLTLNKIQEVYITFDIDAMDAGYASATGTAEKNGLEPHHAELMIQAIASICKVTGADLVEIAPYIQSPAKSNLAPEPYTTLQTAASIARALLDAFHHGHRLP